MLKNFENETHNLSDYELQVIVPLLIKGFQMKVGKHRCITNKQICKSLNTELSLKIVLSEPRVRKCIAYIRYNNCVPRLIATSKGYWVATNKQELLDWKESLQGRIDAIQEILHYADRQISEWDNEHQQHTLNL